MKTIWIALIILGIIVLTVGGFVGYTIYQGYQLANSFDQEQLESDLHALENKDCSKLVGIESRFKETKENLRSACGNPALRSVIEKMASEQGGNVNVCEEANKPDNEIEAQLNEFRNYCSGNAS